MSTSETSPPTPPDNGHPTATADRLEAVQAQFADWIRYREADTFRSWADRVLEHLVEAVEGLQGAFYISAFDPQAAVSQTGDTDTPTAQPLELTGTYAWDPNAMPERVAWGEGIVGQAAKSQQPFYLHNESRQDLAFRNHSGLAELNLHALLVQPLIFNHQVQGVIELTSAEEFSEYQQNLVASLSETLAANLMSVRNQAAVRQLYEEAHQRAEELQAQEEEMRQNVEELEATQDEMKRIQAELKGQSEAIDRSNALVEFSTEGTILRANERFCHLAGYSPVELIGQHHSVLVETREINSPEYKQMWYRLQQGQFVSGTFRRIRRDGASFWVNGSYNPVMDGYGRVVRIVKICMDTTAQMLASQENERIKLELEQQTQAINKSAAVVEFDMRGYVRHINLNFSRLCKYTPQEIEGSHHSVLVPEHEANSERYRLFWEKLQSGQYVVGEFERIDKDGHRFWIQGSYNPIMDVDGKPARVIKFAYDITRQRQQAVEMEQINQEMEAVQLRLRGQVSALNNAAIVSETDLLGNITFANDMFIQISKYSREELLGQNHRMIKSGHQPQEIFDDLWATISRGEVWKGTIKNRAKDGSYYWVLTTVTPELGADGKPQKYIAVRFDFTQQQAQAELIQQQMEEARAQEEEIRQNMEELEASQEESNRIRRELEAQQKAISQASGFIEFDMDGTVKRVNPLFCEYSGYEAEELIGQHHRKLVHPEDLASGEYAQFWKRLHAGETISGKFRRVRKSGASFWLQGSYIPVAGPEGKPYKVIKMAFKTSPDSANSA